MHTDRRQTRASGLLSLTWELVRFDELDASTLYALLAARVAVFVVEQRCAYQELDGRDPTALHLFAVDPQRRIAACARILPPGIRFAEPSIGRVLTNEAYRGRGLGRELMERAICACRARWPQTPIRISAQHQLEGFYRSLGFTTISDVYDEDGIPHIDMRLEAEPSA